MTDVNIEFHQVGQLEKTDIRQEWLQGAHRQHVDHGEHLLGRVHGEPRGEHREELLGERLLHPLRAGGVQNEVVVVMFVRLKLKLPLVQHKSQVQLQSFCMVHFHRSGA